MKEDYFEYKHMTANRDIYSILKEHAKENRKNPTSAEAVLWDNLRNNALGVKFRQQHPILDFIVDFVCLDKKLVIEVDGGYHEAEEQKHQDDLRSERLYKKGYYVLRFSNEEVLNDTEEVLSRIKEIINNIPPTP